MKIRVRQLFVGVLVLLVAALPLVACSSGRGTEGEAPNGADSVLSSGGRAAEGEAPRGADSVLSGGGKAAEGEAPRGADSVLSSGGRTAEGEAPRGADSVLSGGGADNTTAGVDASGRAAEGEAPRGADSVLSGAPSGGRAAEGEAPRGADSVLSGGGGNSGPGYPTGPLDMTISAVQLILDRVGAVKPGEVKDRQYEADGTFSITINGAAYNVTSLKVISNLRVKNGIGEHNGTIDIDKDTLPGFHLTLGYKGTATVSGNTITSSGTFKTSKTTGVFAGLVAEGSYTMTIVESGQTSGAPVTVTIKTVSFFP